MSYLFLFKFFFDILYRSRHKDTWACHGNGVGDSSGEGERGRVRTLGPGIQEQVGRRRKGKSRKQRERVKNGRGFEQKFVGIGRYAKRSIRSIVLNCDRMSMIAIVCATIFSCMLSIIIIIITILLITNLLHVDGASENRKRKHGRISPITWENPSNEEKKSGDNPESEFSVVPIITTTL